MNLPWLALQTVYVHVAWAVVLAACGVGLLALRRPLPVRLMVGWVALIALVCALPGRLSPSYWLGLAFHLPSPLMLMLCTRAVWLHVQGRAGERAIHLGLALTIAIAGAVLYADTAGWLYLGLYVRAFGPDAAFFGLMVGGIALLRVTSGVHLTAGMAVLVSLLGYSLLRLPTGNLWDAFIDPWLWMWSLCSLIARALAWWRAPRATPRTVS